MSGDSIVTLPAGTEWEPAFKKIKMNPVSRCAIKVRDKMGIYLE